MINLLSFNLYRRDIWSKSHLNPFWGRGNTERRSRIEKRRVRMKQIKLKLTKKGRKLRCMS